MEINITLLTLVFCAIIVNTNCDRFRDSLKTKYFTNPPQRYYRRPPLVQPINGIFSYTPPPNYMTDDSDQSSPYRPFKVSKRPTEVTPEENINNIIKYMSKKDLNKLIEMAEKEKYIDKFKNPDKYERDERTKPGSDIYKAVVQEMEANNFNPHLYDGKNHNYVKESTQTKLIYTKPPTDNEFFSHKLSSDYHGVNSNMNYLKDTLKIMYPNTERPNQFTNLEELIDYETNVPDFNNMKDASAIINYSNSPYIQNSPTKTTYREVENNPSHLDNTGLDVNEMGQYLNFVQNFNLMSTKDGHIFTDSSVMKEEELPKPVNLREEEYVISHTFNMPTVVKADSSYEVKNFGELPLMNHDNSKLHSVNSYNVPHYTVTTTKQKPPAKQQTWLSSSSSAQKSPEIEYAPPGATGHDQSDAHLKAVKIWTHKSKGTAYTLHNDGTLSLERPLSPKYGR